MPLTVTHERRLRHWVYIAGFFLNISLAVAAYINSSFFEKFVGEEKVGLIYTATYVITFILILYFHRIIERFGIRETLIGLLVLALFTLSGVTIFSDLPVGIILLGINLVLGSLLVASLDLYLEHLSQNSITGWIRGLFLALANFAWLISPILASQLNSRIGFGAVYLVSTLAMIPLFYITLRYLATFPKRAYHRTGFLKTIGNLWLAEKKTEGSDILRVITVDFLLNFFYATMVIYLPIMLHQYIGFTWPQIGVILTIMLIPFVVIDLLLGRVADHIGEKEMILSGLVVTGLATLAIPFLTTPSILIWGAILFATRIGAATIELMKESYLFKKVNSEDISIIFLSRSMYPLSYIVAPLVASAILFFAPIQAVFIVMGVIVLVGVPIVGRLKDTK